MSLEKMIYRCEYLINWMTEQEENGVVTPTMQLDLELIRFALHKLMLPVAPQDTAECAQYLADMKWGEFSPQIGANTLSELGALALLGLKYKEAISNENR